MIIFIRIILASFRSTFRNYGKYNQIRQYHFSTNQNTNDQWNPVRDTIFMGNDDLYHQVGGLFTTASAIMIPIGQTQSVTKGLTEFAIGEVGGFLGGQAGYHGTNF